MSANEITLLALIVIAAVILDLALIQVWRAIRAHPQSAPGKKGLFISFTLEVVRLCWFFTPLILAAIPAWFVFFHRWHNDLLFYLPVFRAWHVWRLKDFLAYPYYFFLVFVSTGLLFGMGLFLRKKFWSFLVDKGIVDHAVRRNATASHENKHIAFVAPSGRMRFGRYTLLGFCFLLFYYSNIHFLSVGSWPGLQYATLCVLFILGMAWQDVFEVRWVSVLRQNVDLWISAGLAHVSVVILLSGVYSGYPALWVGISSLILTHLNLIRHRKKLNPVFWIVTLATIVYSLGINAWWFSVIGDEYVFYRNAHWIVSHPLEIPSELFNGEYVYGTHPFFSSLLQSIFLFSFGSTNFSWRFSGLYLAAISLFFFYDFFRRFLSHSIALWAVALIASSHYLITFGKIGYNNLQALFALSLVLWAAGWAVQSNRLFAYALVGCTQAFCFYVYPAALYIVPLPFLLIGLHPLPPQHKRLRQWAVMLGVFLLLIFPLLFQFEFWATKLEGTLLSQLHKIATLEAANRYLASNFVYTLFSPIYIPSEVHFVAVSFLDPLTGVFLLLGMTLLVWVFWRHPFLRFFLISFGYLLIIIGTTHGRATPPTTRMFLLLPWWSVLATFGMFWMVERFKQFGAQENHLRWPYLILLLLILGVNLLQAFPVSFRRVEQYRSFQMYFLKMTQTIWKLDEKPPGTLLFISDQSFWIDTLGELLTVYQIPYQDTRLFQVFNLSVAPDSILRDPTSLILFPPPWEETRLSKEITLLESLNYQPCQILKTDGVMVFEVWYTEPMSWVCDILHFSPFEPLPFGVRFP